MSITADPLFIAAEIEWRYGPVDTGHWPTVPSRHGHGIRESLSNRLHHRHARHARPSRPANPRVA